MSNWKPDEKRTNSVDLDFLNQIKNSRLKVKVIPNSAKTEVKGIRNGSMILTVAAPPEKDKANKELVKFFKRRFGLNVAISKGKTSREKILAVACS